MISMRKNILIGCLIFLTFVFQTFFDAMIPDSFVTPDFLLVTSCSLGFLMGKRAGMWTGFLSGLLLDLIYSGPFGLTALIFMFAGFFNGFLYKLFFEDDIRIPMISTGIADFLYQTVLFIAEKAAVGAAGFGTCLINMILPEVFATILAVIPLFLIYRWLARKVQATQLEEEESPWLR